MSCLRFTQMKIWIQNVYIATDFFATEYKKWNFSAHKSIHMTKLSMKFLECTGQRWARRGLSNTSKECQKKHCKNCKCCPASLLIVRSQRWSELRFSIVRIVISVSSVASLQDCLCIVKIVHKKREVNVCQVMFPHQSGQVSQRSQVSRVPLCMSKVKVPWVIDYVI